MGRAEALRYRYYRYGWAGLKPCATDMAPVAQGFSPAIQNNSRKFANSCTK
jgi:hypothetical protein